MIVSHRVFCLPFSLACLLVTADLRAQTLIGADNGGFWGQNDFVSSSSSVGGPFNGVNINQLLGANRFYNAGYAGQRAIVANVEAGLVWNRHETLTSSTVQIYAPGFHGTQLGEYDRHATWVGMDIAGRPTAGGGEYQRGIAYGTTLWSGAIATQWNGNPFTTTFGWSNGNAFLYPYLTAMQTGVQGRTTDVVNSSWGYTDPTGSSIFSVTLDGLARGNRKTVVVSAGNNGPGVNTVEGPASGYNVISVGALASDTDLPAYSTVAGFSSRGPNDFYNPVTGVTIPGVRARIDICAPGQNLTLAYYGGVTGGNRGGFDDSNGATNYYEFGTAGTSFAAPTVSGGAALLIDAGYARYNGGNAIDPRVIKAVLLNSADKLPGWDNGQKMVQGVLTTTQALDYAQGAGRLNLSRAYDQYLSGMAGVPGAGGGTISSLGWDYKSVAMFHHNDYYFGAPLSGHSSFTATLDWFVNRQFNSVSSGGALSASDLSFANLDLELWRVVAGKPVGLVAESIAPYENTQQLSFLLTDTANYMLEVDYAGNLYDATGRYNLETYGLAWSASSVPEPGAIALLASAGILSGGAFLRRRWQKSLQSKPGL